MRERELIRGGAVPVADAGPLEQAQPDWHLPCGGDARQDNEPERA